MRMHNILSIFKDDLHRLFANAVSTILVIGLAIIPSLFAWYNLLACWDVFDNTGHLLVAVANEDEGYESDLIPIRVNIGDMVISELRANDQIGWRFTDAEDAIDGAKSGKYYAAVVIPKEFSRDMLRFYEPDSQHAQITYYDNEKINAISPKITSIGADTISEKVNTAFAQSISEVMLSVAKSVSRYADDIDLHGQIAALADHVDSMAGDISRVSDVVGMYASTLGSAQKTLDDGSTLIDEAQGTVTSMMNQAQTSLDELSSLSGTIAGAEGDLESALDTAQTSFNDLQALLSDPTVAALIPEDTRQSMERSIQDAQSKLSALRSDYDTTLKPNLDRLVADSGALRGDASQALSDLRDAQSSISTAVESAHGILSDAISQISSATEKLDGASQTLRDLALSISEALVSGDPEALQRILGSDATALSQALSAPVGIEKKAVYPSDSFGSSIAPLYTTIAMFIGALLLMVALKPNVSKRIQAKLKNAKESELFFGHFLCIGCISLAQTTFMALGNLLFLHVQVAHPLLYLLCMWFAGLVFAFLIYALVASFANLGKAIAVILLVAQITGCGGSYPLEILPDFVQWISPFLPATHVVDAMRAAMFGIYQGDYWISMGMIALFIIPAALIGFVLRKPFEKFMTWYVNRIDSTQVIG